VVAVRLSGFAPGLRFPIKADRVGQPPGNPVGS